MLSRLVPTRVSLTSHFPELCRFCTFTARCSPLWTSSCWRRSGFMESPSAALSLSKISIRSAFLTVTENVLSLKVILEANCSAWHLHSLAFFFRFFPLYFNFRSFFSFSALCVPLMIHLLFTIPIGREISSS